MPGLHLATKVVHRISGPVSMTYLKPNMTPPDKKNAYHPYHTLIPDPSALPLILLWGDAHADDTGMCSKCDCDSNQSCCYTIYDKAFLKELDLLATDYPVDFYTESSVDFPRSSAGNKNILFERFFHETVKDCHDRPLRSKKAYETTCPTKNIRWHYSDVRFTSHTIEHYIFYEFTQKVNRLKISKLINDMHDIKDQSTLLESFIGAILHIHEGLFNIDLSPNDKEYILQKEGKKLLLKCYLALFQSKDEKHTIRDIFTEYVDCISKQPVSIVYKQIQKTNAISITNDQLITVLVRAFLLNESYNLSNMLEIIDELNTVEYNFLKNVITDMEMIDTIRVNGDYAPIFKELKLNHMFKILKLFHKIAVLFTAIATLFVDIYAIFRMFKSPKDNSTPYLSMGYFGDAHTTNMISILNNLGYTISFSFRMGKASFGKGRSMFGRSNTDLFRCIGIDQPILLKQDLEERARNIRSHPQHENTFQKYHNVRKREQLSRNTDESRPIQNPFEGGKKTRKVRKGRTMAKKCKRTRRK